MSRVREYVGRRRRRARRAIHDAWRTIRPRTGGIAWRVIEAKRVELARRRTFGPDDLQQMAELAGSAAAVVPIGEVPSHAHEPAGGILTMRHDMDHDLENAVRFAEWEAARGIRSTYYVLHTDWYWGERPDRPSGYLVRAVKRIAALGHEIGLHNNAITVALKTGGDPVEILDGVLTGLRQRGFTISGTVAHGDPLCHVAGYVNYELFAECRTTAFGPPDRTIAFDEPPTGAAGVSGAHHEVRLRPVPMATLGLTHEANFIGHRLYLSDTGGHWNLPFDEVTERFARGDGLLHVLVHPVWWALQGEPVRPRPAGSGASAAPEAVAPRATVKAPAASRAPAAAP